MLIALTETLESAAPLGSFTVPTKLPVSTWANAIAVALIRRTTTMKVFLIAGTPLCPYRFCSDLTACHLRAPRPTVLCCRLKALALQGRYQSLRYLSKLFRFISCEQQLSRTK